MTHEYDVCVLGAGPGGYVAAIRAAQLGLKTCIIEKRYWGGVCLNVGCIPTKSLLRNAELAHIVTHEADTFGIQGEITVDYGKAFSRSRQVSERMTKGIHFLMKKNKIKEFNGWGTFVDAHTIDVADNNGATTRVTFNNVIIAAGSTTKMLTGTRVSANVVTYEEQILADRLPNSIIIGLRLAQLRRRRDHRRVLRPDGSQRGRGDLRRDHQGVQETGHQGADRHQGGVNRGHGQRGASHRQSRQGRRFPGLGGGSFPLGCRVRPAHRGLWFGEHRGHAD